MFYSQQASTIDRLSLEVAEKSLQVNRQQETIDVHLSVIAAWQEELDQKSDQLEALRGEMSVLAKTIESQERLLSEKSQKAQRLETEFARLEVQAASLEKEIAQLQSVLYEKDQSLAGLAALEKESVRRVHVAHHGLGVDEDGKGAVFLIEVEIIGSGDGRISVDVRNVEYESVFQTAVRTAAKVASEYTGVPVSDKDIIVRFTAYEDGLIKMEGPSAGAVLAAMIVAGLEEKKLDPSVLVTGTVSPTGTIGRVGGLVTKADAAVEFGAENLLVPRGQEFHDGRIEIEGVVNMEQLMNRITLAG